MSRGVVRLVEEQPMNSDTLTSADEVIASLRAHAADLRAAGIRHLSLFGSVARGEAGPESDIDLAVELDADAHITLIGLAGLEFRLGELLGRKVDLLPEPIQKPRLRTNVERDRRRVF
jgi:predicted nucleotidyltransferase